MDSYNTVKIQTIEIFLATGKSYCFNNSDVLIPAQEFALFSKSLDIIFGDNHKRQCLNAGDQVLAKVDLTRSYLVSANKAFFVVTDESGNDCTAEYRKLIAESEESYFIRHFEKYKKEEYPHKLKDYRSLADDELDIFACRTDGIGATRTFRNYMTSFIRNFKNERLIDEKPFVLTLNKNGEFCVENINCPDQPISLSENELVVYHYLCYLHLSRFWSEVEILQNQNHLTLPLIVDDFLDHLDKAIDIAQLVKKAQKLNRQAFFAKQET